MVKEENKEEYLVDATMDHFTKINLTVLRSFVNVRNPDYTKVSKIPNKGGAIEEKEGKVNMISIVYHSCKMQNYMKDDAMQVDTNVELEDIVLNDIQLTNKRWSRLSIDNTITQLNNMY